jgi:hypothetical protein
MGTVPKEVVKYILERNRRAKIAGFIDLPDELFAPGHSGELVPELHRAYLHQDILTRSWTPVEGDHKVLAKLYESHDVLVPKFREFLEEDMNNIPSKTLEALKNGKSYSSFFKSESRSKKERKKVSPEPLSLTLVESARGFLSETGPGTVISTEFDGLSSSQESLSETRRSFIPEKRANKITDFELLNEEASSLTSDSDDVSDMDSLLNEMRFILGLFEMSSKTLRAFSNVRMDILSDIVREKWHDLTSKKQLRAAINRLKNVFTILSIASDVYMMARKLISLRLASSNEMLTKLLQFTTKELDKSSFKKVEILDYNGYAELMIITFGKGKIKNKGVIILNRIMREGCEKILNTGESKGLRCGKKCVDDNIFCKIHMSKGDNLEAGLKSKRKSNKGVRFGLDKKIDDTVPGISALGVPSASGEKITHDRMKEIYNNFIQKMKDLNDNKSFLNVDTWNIIKKPMAVVSHKSRMASASRKRLEDVISLLKGDRLAIPRKITDGIYPDIITKEDKRDYSAAATESAGLEVLAISKDVIQGSPRRKIQKSPVATIIDTIIYNQKVIFSYHLLLIYNFRNYPLSKTLVTMIFNKLHKCSFVKQSHIDKVIVYSDQLREFSDLLIKVNNKLKKSDPKSVKYLPSINTDLNKLVNKLFERLREVLINESRNETPKSLLRIIRKIRLDFSEVKETKLKTKSIIKDPVSSLGSLFVKAYNNVLGIVNEILGEITMENDRNIQKSNIKPSPGQNFEVTILIIKILLPKSHHSALRFISSYPAIDRDEPNDDFTVSPSETSLRNPQVLATVKFLEQLQRNHFEMVKGRSIRAETISYLNYFANR